MLRPCRSAGASWAPPRVLGGLSPLWGNLLSGHRFNASAKGTDSEGTLLQSASSFFSSF